MFEFVRKTVLAALMVFIMGLCIGILDADANYTEKYLTNTGDFIYEKM